MLLLLLLSRFSRVWLCATPKMAAHQAPRSLGFSRQEHWSRLLFPSPVYESEMWKWSHPVVTLSDPMDCSLPGSSVHGIFQSRALEWGAIAFSIYFVYMHAKSLQSCPTLCDPMDCSPPGSSVHRILQARILEWVAIPFFRGSSPSRGQTHVSCVSCIVRQVLYYYIYSRSVGR